MIDRIDLAYMAGIIDGEGFITLGRNHNTVTPRMGITNTDPRLIEWVQARWPGSIVVRHPLDRRPEFQISQPSIMWDIRGTKVIPVVKELRPYLRLKGEQADIVLSFWELHEEFEIHSGIKVPQGYAELVEVLHTKIFLLNSRKYKASQAYGMAESKWGRSIPKTR